MRASQIEPAIQAGPRWKLETFLEALDILEEARAVLGAEECAKGMRKAEALCVGRGWGSWWRSSRMPCARAGETPHPMSFFLPPLVPLTKRERRARALP